MGYAELTSLTTPAIYHRGRAYVTEFDPSPSARYWFGGELNLKVTGLPHGQNPLHRILTIDLTDEFLGITAPEDLKQVPLVYGIRVEACEMTYEATSTRQIKLKRGWELGASDDWPYANYPDTLPHLGLRLLKPVASTIEAFSEYTHQGLVLAEPDEMIILVPSIENYGGVSLWGEHGWGVQIIFYLTLADRIVNVTQQCD